MAAEDFDELYQAHYGNVVAMAYGLTGDLAEAQDLAQEAFCRAWQRWGWFAPTGTGAMYALPPQVGPHLFDLDRTGERLLVVALSCLQLGNESTDGLAVFERADGGWQGISVLVSPTGQPPSGWSMEGDRFTVDWAEGAQRAYRWSGTELIPVDD